MSYVVFKHVAGHQHTPSRIQELQIIAYFKRRSRRENKLRNTSTKIKAERHFYSSRLELFSLFRNGTLPKEI